MLWYFCRLHWPFQMMLTSENRQLRSIFIHGSFIKNTCNSIVITVPADLICNKNVPENHKSKIAATWPRGQWYYSDIIMSMIKSQITSISIVCSAFVQVQIKENVKALCHWPLCTYDIKNNAWVTVNNDFLSRVRRFGNDFHEWRSHEWKSLPIRITSDKKIRYSR